MPSFNCQLDTLENHPERVSGRDCLDQVGQWMYLWGVALIAWLMWEDLAHYEWYCFLGLDPGL